MSFHIFTSFLNIGDRIGPVVQKKPHSSRVRPRLKLIDERNHGTAIEDLNASVHKAHATVDTILSRIFYCSVDLMDLMQNVETGPIHSSPEKPVKQTVPDDPLPAVKLLIQFYRISSAVHVVCSVAIATVCHHIFPPFNDNLRNLF